ncbi:hypothetical protein F4813DRAFT_398188 [Daldinia decipiens]|uniref:uncharacterized protein n=1 Tax=Daldinia decipiens TaxID=326647 RepID=UPI0020C2DF92|nr:uncharacterized protein F4813DRAFT_398188 [Daldinia decipiens]KAI1661575.1 hypothetical protein F4813DRAFT_398188 [Daldinia decipiens]
MFGRGNIEDAKQLQASFTRAKSPRRNKRNQDRRNGINTRQGGALVNHRQQHNQYGQGSSVQGRAQLGSSLIIHPRGNVMQHHPVRSTQEGITPTSRPHDMSMSLGTIEPQAILTEGILPLQGPSVSQNVALTIPAPQETWQKRLASSNEEGNIASKRLKGGPTGGSAQLQMPTANSPPPPQFCGQNFGPQGVDGHFQTAKASTPSRDQLQLAYPTQSNNNLVDPTLAYSSDASTLVSQRAPWHHYSDSIQSEISILDEGGEPISQDVMQFTTRNEARQDDDVAMGGVETSSKVKVGLKASRWNPDNPNRYPEKHFPEHFWGEPMRVDPPTQEKRGPSVPTGQTVISGISKGPGLADSRWAS